MASPARLIGPPEQQGLNFPFCAARLPDSQALLSQSAPVDAQGLEDEDTGRKETRSMRLSFFEGCNAEVWRLGDGTSESNGSGSGQKSCNKFARL
jgi:hypothetical protein